jgi:hypothetical protein
MLPPRRARAWLVTTLVLVAAGARAESERLVLGTHDAALAAALSVAVSPRGLSVVELAEPLGGPADPTARRELRVPGTVAVVWLCEDGPAHALCFSPADGHVVVKPISVTSPLTPPDAAAIALSVKMLLGAPAPPAPARAPVAEPAGEPAARAPTAAAPAPAPAAPAAPAQSAAPARPALVLEVGVGARVQSPAAGHVGLRVGVRGVLAPEIVGRALGAGVGLDTGPALAASAPAGRTIDDSAVELFARGRLALAPPVWLELDAGPSLHLLSVAAGPSASSRVEIALDGRLGVVVPAGRALLGVRAGGFYVATSPATSGATLPVALPRWNGEAMLTVGLAVR